MIFTRNMNLPLAKEVSVEIDPDGGIIPHECCPVVEALGALRQAVVAQTALLRSLSEQVRIGFEAHYAILKANQILLQGIDTVQDAIRFEAQRDRKEARDQIHISRHETIKHFDSLLAGLAERLEKLEAQIITYDTNQTERAVTVSGRLQALEAKLSQSENDASADWMQARKLLELTNKRLKAIESKAHKPARRKAKR